MESRIRETILSIVPDDGSNVGNQSLFQQAKERLKSTGDGYDKAMVNAVREQLITEGVLGKGRGRGGSSLSQILCNCFSLIRPDTLAILDLESVHCRFPMLDGPSPSL